MKKYVIGLACLLVFAAVYMGYAGVGHDAILPTDSIYDALYTKVNDDILELFTENNAQDALIAAASSPGTYTPCTSGTRPAFAAVSEGHLIWESDTNRCYTADKTNLKWRIVSGTNAYSTLPSAATYTIDDGTLVVDTDDGNRYSYDGGSAKWRIVGGNIYATDPSAATYTIETGTVIFQTTASIFKRYSGAAWLAIATDNILTAKTANYPLTANDLVGNTTFTNNGAGAEINFTLLAGVAGLKTRFIVTDAQYLKVTAAGTNTFRYTSVQGAAGGYIRSNIVGTVWEIEYSGDDWVIRDLTGTLNMDE